MENKILNIELKEKKWKYFEYGDAFIIKKGQRLTLYDQEKGNTPYVSSSSVNNGIDNYISNGYTDENCLSFACYGSIGYVFYHPYKAWISDNCNVFYIKGKKLNEYIAMFLIPILELERFRFSYGMTAKAQRLRKFKIKLPVKSDNDIDWNFIEDFIKSIKTTIKEPNPDSILKDKIKLEIEEWEDFELSKLFKIEKGERITTYDRIQDDKNIPLIAASSENNGVVDFISQLGFISDKKVFEKKITIDMFWNVFYHDYKYFSDDNVHTLVPQFKTNKYISLFIVSILRKLNYKYSFGRQSRINRIEKEEIKLPVKNNQPDWEFMEKYIKSLPYSSSL